MRILFSSTRGSGHLQPLLPYAQTLRSLGHQVLVTAPGAARQASEDAGLDFREFDHPGDDALKSVWDRQRQMSADEAMVSAVYDIFAGLNARAALPKLQSILESFRPELVVRESLEFGSAIAAAEFGIPVSCVQVHVGFLDERMLGLAAPQLDNVRSSLGSPMDMGARLRSEVIFTSFPASLDKEEAMAHRRVHRVRTETTAPKSETLPPWILHQNVPLVYITFGTVTSKSPQHVAVYRKAMEAVADLPVQAVLTTGQNLDSEVLGIVPPNVHVAVWIPQREILAHAQVVVCHGGSGTVLGSLSQGVPLVVLPMFADQPLNAERISAVGAGVSPSGQDVAALRASILDVLMAPHYQERAQLIANEMTQLLPIKAAAAQMLALAQ